MKSANRTRLLCSKKLPCGVWDKFSVVVATGRKDAAKSGYKEMGYTVKEILL